MLLLLYAFISVFAGAVLCSYLAWRRNVRAASVAGIIFFGGPLAAYLALVAISARSAENFQQDLAYVKELCEKYGGDKIFKTVENVQGVFQITPTNPDPDNQWADQMGMAEPWALAYGAAPNASWLGVRGRGYWFVEQQPGYSLPKGPPYRRAVLVQTASKATRDNPDGTLSEEGTVLERKEFRASALKSRYGYSTEDLTTPELRKRWIGGGRLKIVDLESNEVLAERVGFFRASGGNYKLAWSAGVGCRHDQITYVHAFILSVLRPPASLPTESQLIDLTRDRAP